MQYLNVLFSQAHCLVLKFQCFHFFGSQLLACVCVRGLLCVFKYTWHHISIYHVLLYLYFVSVRSRRPCMCKYTSRTTPHHILYLEFWRYCFTKFCSFCAPSLLWWCASPLSLLCWGSHATFCLFADCNCQGQGTSCAFVATVRPCVSFSLSIILYINPCQVWNQLWNSFFDAVNLLPLVGMETWLTDWL